MLDRILGFIVYCIEGRIPLDYSGTPPNATGADADLVNAVYKLGWQNDVIE